MSTLNVIHLRIMSQYDQFFSQVQIGRGISDIGPIYKSRAVFQRGRGLSSVFQGLLRILRPYIASGTKALKKEGFRAASEILGKVGQGQPIRNILKEQGNKSLMNLSEKAGNKLDEIRNELLTGQGINSANPSVLDFISSLKPSKRGTTKSKRQTKVQKKPKSSTTRKKKTVKRKPSKAAFVKKFLKVNK